MKTFGDVASDVLESASTALVLPTVVTAVLVEGFSASVPAVASYGGTVSPGVLLVVGIKLLCDPGLDAVTCVFFIVTAVSCEVTRGEEGLSSPRVEEAGKGEVMAGEDGRRKPEVVSSTEGGCGFGTVLGSPLRRAVTSEWGRL